MTGILIAIAIAGIWALAYFYSSAKIWLGAGIMYAIAATLWFGFSVFTVISWALVILFGAFIATPSIRQKHLSRPLFSLYKSLMPAMSQTEQEALDAGSVWWDEELFSGRPNWKRLFALPAAKLSAEEQAYIDGPVEELCALIDDWQLTHIDHDLSQAAWQFIKQKRFFGMIIPKEYGGLAFTAQGHSQIVKKVASRSISAGVTVMVPNSLGPAELLMHYGTTAQKDYYLPRLAKGEEIPCFALTAPEAGSDAGSMTDSGVICKKSFEGKETLGIQLNWNKRYITLAPVATVLGLAFKLYDPDKLLGDKEALGITLALIPTDTPGVTIGRRHLPMNLAFMNGPTTGHDVFIPIDWIIGGKAQIGHGWKMLMDCLAEGRAISLPALSTAASKTMSRTCSAYAGVRRQFKVSIGSFEGISEVLARMGGFTYGMEATRSVTAGVIDSGEKPSILSAITKYQLTERMRMLINDGMDIQGGKAICMGPSNFMARPYQAIPISITVEGANILTRSLIIFGQGAIRCHPYLLKEIGAVNNADENKALQQFDAAFFAHLGFFISNIARSLFMGITFAWFTSAPNEPHNKRYYQKINHLSSIFAMLTDMFLFILGGTLKRKEKISGRLADILSQMYVISCTLKQYKDNHYPINEKPLLDWFIQDALYRAQIAMDGLVQNFPIRGLGWLVKLLIWPLGKPYKSPSDSLGQTVADILLTPSETRDNLTSGIYLPKQIDQSIGGLEDAFVKVYNAQPIEVKIKQAMKSKIIDKGDPLKMGDIALEKNIISKLEHQALKEANSARERVIQVDDFPFDFQNTVTHCSEEIIAAS